ncbi:putative PH domain-containing protein [Rosellinia necatrix]|uniref:Putative PH domain-containing protein n=1 Tax=Rosellinia necatrix TaxID=77044 RepID=A0A1W2TLV1_ROSNE|nr:putative PH domain-containing protein [Rosellinia necatrix]
MGSYIAKWIGGKLIQDKILKERLENKFGVDDPYFEQVPATRLDGTPNGKFKKVRKAVPPGISAHDAEVLNKVKRRAYRLDMAFGSFLGIKFGWGSLLALFPIFGDFADTFLGFLVVRTAKKVEGGLPPTVLLAMYFWLVIDLVIGLVPFVGDLADAMVLANTRNAAALEEHLRQKGKKNLRASGKPLPASDPSDPVEFDRLHTETPNTSRPIQNREPTNQPSTRHAPQTSGVVSTQRPLPQPAPARVHDDRQGRSGGGFFGFGRKKSRPTDIEAGAGRAS